MQHKDNIWINGCFDVLHMGHIKLFRRARQMGMRVIVGIDTDERIRQAKGENRPVNDLHNRIDFLRSMPSPYSINWPGKQNATIHQYFV